MADTENAHAVGGSHDAQAGHEHGEHHLPPNSWAPISVALSICMVMVGLVAAVWVWSIGLVWFIASLAAWLRGARNEFKELPDRAGGH